MDWRLARKFPLNWLIVGHLPSLAGLSVFVGIWLLGFSLAVPTTIILYLKFAKEKWPITLALALAAWLFFYGLFDYALHVPFPDGQLFLWLGLIAS